MPAGLWAISATRATQYSAEAPSRYQSLSPYTRSPTPTSLTPAPRAAISPENSCPGMTGNGRGSPARVVQVGTQESSVGMTPAAWTVRAPRLPRDGAAAPPRRRAPRGHRMRADRSPSYPTSKQLLAEQADKTLFLETAS